MIYADLWPAMRMSLQVAAVATGLVVLVGVPLAFALSRWQFPGRSLVDALITLPLVLPPTVVGYLLIILLGSRGWIGQWLRQWFDYTILFRFEGAVIAAAVVALPMVYLPAKAAFATVETELEQIARLFGANAVQIFWHVSLPIARRGVASGALLAFARALGEFGATVMVLGQIAEKQTLPIKIYSDYIAGEPGKALGAVVALSVISLLVIITYNRSQIDRRE